MLTYIHMWRWCYYPSSQLNMLNGMRWNRKVKMSVVPRIIGACLVVIVLQASSPGLIPVTVSLFFSSLLQHQTRFYMSVFTTQKAIPANCSYEERTVTQCVSVVYSDLGQTCVTAAQLYMIYGQINRVFWYSTSTEIHCNDFFLHYNQK